jgi:hypothetical protein
VGLGLRLHHDLVILELTPRRRRRAPVP